MPATEYFGYQVTNLGPLTTTFTAAASCATQDLALAEDFLEDWPPLLYYTECEFPPPDTTCLPSASESAALHSSFEDGGASYQGAVAYFSPASICPSGWETVGVATMSSGSGSLSKSGFFTEPTRPEPTRVAEGSPFVMMPPDVHLGALQDGESLVWCCPSNHTANLYGFCLSTVGPWDPLEQTQFRTICDVHASATGIDAVTSFDGTVWDPPLATWDRDTIEYMTYKETLAPTMTDHDLYVVHSVVALALVNKSGDEDKDDDNDGGRDDSNSNDENNHDNGDEGGNGDDDDAAPSIRALALIPLTVVGLGFLAGMGVLMPW